MPAAPAPTPIHLSSRCDTREFFKLPAALEQMKDTTLLARSNLHKLMAHDCQRLLSDITWARDSGFLHRAPLVSLLVRSATEMDGFDFTQGVIAAEMINYDAQGYDPLGIRTGINCLWLQKTDAGWVASIYMRGQGCAHSTPAPADPNLEVRAHNAAPPGSYPSTARWMWDSKSWQQFIGVRCGDAWCEVGPRGFYSDTQLTDRYSIPGWGDDQILTYVDNGRLRASDIHGRIRPAQELMKWADSYSAGGAPDGPFNSNMYDATNPYSDSMRPAALVTLTKIDTPTSPTPAHEKYRAAYDFSVGGAQPDSIFMTTTGNTWTVHTGRDRRYDPVTKVGRAFHPVKKVGHSHGPHGSVRWAWDEKDERAWMSCDQGCCTPDPPCTTC